MKDLGQMARRALRRKNLALASMLLAVVQCALKLWLPRLMEDAVNNGVMKQSLEYVTKIGGKMLLVCVALGVCGYVCSILTALFGHLFARDLREEVYAHVTSLSALQASAMGQGALITGLTADVDVCAALSTATIQLAVEPVLLTVGGIFMMWRLAPVFGMVFTGFVAVQLCVMALFIRSTAPGFQKVREAMDAMNSRLQTAFSGFRLAKATNAQASECARFNARNDGLFSAAYCVQRRIALFNPLVMLIMNAAVGCILWLSGRGVAAGTLNVGRVLSAITYSEQVLLSIMAGGQMYRRITEAQPSARRLGRILDTRPDLSGGETPLDEPFRELRFEDVSFEYPGGGRVLQGVSFTLRAGETVALIGPIGSGKSTLAGLCARLFDATGGSVRLNGEDIRHWRLPDARRAVALVEKQTAVLEGTVAENLRFGREGISEADMQRALTAAQMREYIDERPDGLDSPLVSMGRSLSGGERQRLTIARALSGSPGVLVLDDATSSLDYRTERALLEALKRDYPDLAVLLITNRLASAAQADRIMLLDGGTIAAQGTDATLRQSSPLYRRVLAIQDGKGAE